MNPFSKILLLAFVVSVLNMTDSLAARPAITSPTPWSNLSGTSSVNFQWSNGGLGGITAYKLDVGSSFGATDVFSSANLSSRTTNWTVGDIPSSDNFYVRLSFQVNGSWESSDFCYRNTTSPQILSPTPGNELTGSSTNFYWTGNSANVQQWWVSVGTSLGASNILYYNAGANTNVSVSNLPVASNTTVYFRLWYHTGSWNWKDYQFSAVSNGTAMTNAASGELIGESKTFEWDPHGTTPDYYWLYVGSEPGGDDIKNQGVRTGTSYTFGGLPTDGRLIYVRLWSKYTGGGSTIWLHRDYEYNSYVGGFPRLIQPSAGSRFLPTPDNEQTYAWTADNGQIEQWFLYVGSTSGSNDHYRAAFAPNVNQIQVPDLPTHGQALYNTFWFKSGGRWLKWNHVVFAALTNDFDGDGVKNDWDPDVDGDGLTNDNDPDVDGDGVSNAPDSDADGDGVIDEEDDTPSGPTSLTHHTVTLSYDLKGEADAVFFDTGDPILWERFEAGSGTVDIALAYGIQYEFSVSTAGGSGSLSIDLKGGAWIPTSSMDPADFEYRTSTGVVGSDSYEIIYLLPVEGKYVDRDAPNDIWETNSKRLPTGQPIYSQPPMHLGDNDVCAGDLVSWEIKYPVEFSPNITFTWDAVGPEGLNPQTVTGIAGPNKKLWKIAEPLNWRPGKYRIRCRMDFPDGGQHLWETNQEIGVRSGEIMVIGWIAAAAIHLPDGNVSPQTLNGVGSNTIEDILESPSSRGVFLGRMAAINGFPYKVSLTPDVTRKYFNAYLIKHSGNPEPPGDFTKLIGGDKIRIVDSQALVNYLQNGQNYRLAHRLQVKFLVDEQGKIKGDPIPAPNWHEAGLTTVDFATEGFLNTFLGFVDDYLNLGPGEGLFDNVPSEEGPHHGLLNKNGASVSFNDGTTYSANLPDGIAGYAQGRISTIGEASGGKISKVVNQRDVPWIWSEIEFKAPLAKGTVTTTPQHEIFPAVWVYFNGRLIDMLRDDIEEDDLEDFIQLGEVIE